MPPYASRIVGGSVFQNGALQRADLLIDGEEIAAVVRPGEAGEALEVIDATGRVVLPGMIDTHVHARDPGYTHKEDFRTATEAAAAGGITTLVDMPNVEPPTNTAERLRSKREELARKAVVDFGHWVSGTNAEEIAAMAEAGAVGFKIVQLSGEYPRDGRLACNDDGELLRLFRMIGETGLPCVVHPFNQQLFDRLADDALAAGEPPNWLTFSRVYVEASVWDSAVHSLVMLQRMAGVHLHIAHLHSTGAIETVRHAKATGQDVTAEIDPKYYWLSLEDLHRLRGRACPAGFVREDPVRVEAIWRALRDGTIDSISTDHAPHTREDAEQLDIDAFKGAAGLPLLDWAYTLLLNDVAERRLTLQRLMQLVAEQPARLIGVWPRKGHLSPGADADLVVADLDGDYVISDHEVRSKCGWTPYDGRRVRTRVELVMRRGEIVARDHVVTARPGSGRPVRWGG